MGAWIELARAFTPRGDELTLRRRDREFEIRFNGWELMSSRGARSEMMLATLVCRSLTEPRPQVLVGGLGLGYTVRAALDALGGGAVVVVAELIPAIVDWNRTLVADIAGRPLEDSRVTVVNDDVVEIIRSRKLAFDAILLDVDNGPDAVMYASNQILYSHVGLDLIKRSLNAGGVLAVWSADNSAKFEQTMDVARMKWRRVPIDARGGNAGPDHAI
jgi:spermidine synthase